MADEDEREEEAVSDAEENEEEIEIVPGSTHDPFAFKIFTMSQASQLQNGLRHNDHLRYRQYCARRLRRLHKALRFKHGKGRFKAAPFPAEFQDIRFLELLLVNAERSWSFGIQLKSDNATASQHNPRFRLHSIRRLSKAVKWAHKLEEACKVHADARTQLEAEAYFAFMDGTLLLEKEQWSDALTKIQRCKKLCEHLGLAAGQADGSLFKTKVQDLAPAIRECKYNLGQGYGDDEEGENAPTKSARGTQSTSDIKYRGKGLVIPSEKIKAQLTKCLNLVNDVKVDAESGGNDVIEKYGELSASFGDALKDIHADMIAAGADGQTGEWHSLEAFARELSIVMNVERNLVLLRDHLAKLDSLEDIGSSESRRACRPEEGMRFCDLLKEDICSLRELPDTSDTILQKLEIYIKVVSDCRCFFLALCHSSVGKMLESAALMDLLRSRVDECDVTKALPEPLGRLHSLFEVVQKGMANRVGEWRCRGLAQLAIMTVNKSKDAENIAPTNKPKLSLEEIANAVGAFPPRVRDIPCKPLLFDLAFPMVEAPDLSEFQSKKGGAIASGSRGGDIGGGAGDDKRPGILGRVGTGLGKLSSLWGKK